MARDDDDDDEDDDYGNYGSNGDGKWQNNTSFAHNAIQSGRWQDDKQR
jgi:hypothetical protein